MFLLSASMTESSKANMEVVLVMQSTLGTELTNMCCAAGTVDVQRVIRDAAAVTAEVLWP